MYIQNLFWVLKNILFLMKHSEEMFQPIKLKLPRLETQWEFSWFHSANKLLAMTDLDTVLKNMLKLCDRLFGS